MCFCEIVQNQNERIKALESKYKPKKNYYNLIIYFLFIQTLEIIMGLESKRLV